MKVVSATIRCLNYYENKGNDDDEVVYDMLKTTWDEVDNILKSFLTPEAPIKLKDFNAILKLASIVYDPETVTRIYADGNERFILFMLMNPSCQFAANLAALVTAMEEKLDIIADGLLDRLAENKKNLFCNPHLTELIKRRYKRAKRDNEDRVSHQRLTELRAAIMRRASHLKGAPVPHTPDLLWIFGGEAGVGLPSTGSSTATSHHERFLTHIFKVAFCRAGPFPDSHAAEHHVEEENDPLRVRLRGVFSKHCTGNINTEPISTVRLGGPKSQPLTVQNIAELLYGDHEAVLAYKYLQRTHPELVASSIVPGSFDLKDYPPDLSFINDNASLDTFKFITSLAFGAGWDEHLTDERATVLLGNDKGHFSDTEYILTGSEYPIGIGNLALVILQRFVRSAIDAAPSNRETGAAERLVAKIQNVAQKVKTVYEKQESAIVAHLLLFKAIDIAHELRHTTIERKSFSIHMSLRNNIDIPSTTDIDPCIINRFSAIDESAIERAFECSGLSDGLTRAFNTTDITIAWDANRAMPVSVVCNAIRTHHYIDHSHPETLRLKRLQRKAVQEYLRENKRDDVGPFYSYAASRSALARAENATSRKRASNISAPALRGFFAESRDVFEMAALKATASTAAEATKEIAKSISEMRAVTVEAQQMQNIIKDTLESNRGIILNEPAGNLLVASTGQPLAKEMRYLRSNFRSASEVMGELKLDVPSTIDEPYAAEMAATYPDSDIAEIERASTQIVASLPKTDIEILQKVDPITSELPVADDELVTAVSKTKANVALEKTLGQKVANGVMTFVGRFGVILIVGGVATGVMAPTVVARMHASRGAHENVKTNTLSGKVLSYKILKYSCRDKKPGTATLTRHPFDRKINEAIRANPNTMSESGAIITVNGKQSRHPAFAPICGKQDTKAGECGTWAVFDKGSALPVIASISDLPVGTSLSCDGGLSLSQAVADVAIDIGADVAKRISQAAIEGVDDMVTGFLRTIVYSPPFLIGLPIVVGIGTGLVKKSVPAGLVVGLLLLCVLLIVRSLLETNRTKRADTDNRPTPKAGSYRRFAPIF